MIPLCVPGTSIFWRKMISKHALVPWILSVFSGQVLYLHGFVEMPALTSEFFTFGRSAWKKYTSPEDGENESILIKEIMIKKKTNKKPAKASQTLYDEFCLQILYILIISHYYSLHLSSEKFRDRLITWQIINPVVESRIAHWDQNPTHKWDNYSYKE